MRYLLCIFCLICLTACSTRQINGKQQTFTEYVVLNKNSTYKGKSVKDWKEQPSENFIGIRFIKWFEK